MSVYVGWEARLYIYNCFAVVGLNTLYTHVGMKINHSDGFSKGRKMQLVSL